MKKAIALLAFICHFAVTSGVTVNSHYCMDRLASVHLFESSAESCGVCGMDTHAYELNGCCRDEVKIAKLEQDEQQLALASYDIPALESPVTIPSIFLVARFENSNELRHFLNHSPPLLSGQDTYLQNNVFRV